MWIGAGVVCLVLLLAGPGLQAQQRWDFTKVTETGHDKHNVQVDLDAYGNSHMVWGDKDPDNTGLQLFYTNDATGRFTAPILATDTGTVYDISLAARSSFVFRVDAAGAAHIAFIANVDNQLRLFYTNNVSNRFKPAILVADQVRYDMAVDSLGNAHIVWLSVESGIISLNYWNSAMQPQESVPLETLPCNSARYGCSVGYPEIEAGKRPEMGLTIAFRADSSSIYLTQAFSHSAMGLTLLPAPKYDPIMTMTGRADLRLRMALDTFGGIHILAPNYTTSARHQLLYITNAAGNFRSKPLQEQPYPSAPSDFDLESNGGDILAATWTIGPLSVPPPTVGYAEWKRQPSGRWNSQNVQQSIAPAGSQVAGNGIKLSVRGDDAVISGLYRDLAGGSHAGLYRRQAQAPRISYLHPDAAAAGMNVVVEAIAEYREKGSFGIDGFFPDVVKMELNDPADTARLIIGPSVVSWDGRVVSTMLFVPADAKPGAIPIRLRLNKTTASNYDTFHIVTPTNGVFTRGTEIGRGERSRRGVLVVDSLILSGGTFTVDTSDTDLDLPGNQGLLPVTILSLGPVRIDSTATLSLSGTAGITATTYGVGGPGGGGGGSGGWTGAGPGFTGGGGIGFVYGSETMGISRGSGGYTSGRWMGGPALNGAPGGAVYPNAAGGGGTGHPFGASGTFGRVSLDEPTIFDGGGYGGGSAGFNAIDPRGTSGGGGGGYGTEGKSGNPGNERSNAGLPVGSEQLVPLAGGSGGGGGGYVASGSVSGGAGGGALSLISFGSIEINGALTANGAPGMDGKLASGSGGGGGSGGGILLAAKEGIVLGESARVSARGGSGGKPFSAAERPGGDGGDGRIRIDGGSGRTFTRSTPSPGYTGPATSSGRIIAARQGELIQGYGEPGSLIRLFVRPAGGKWSYNNPIDTVVGSDGTWAVRLRGDLGNGNLHVVAMQRVANPSRDEFTNEPEWIMSPAGGNAVGLPRIKRDRGERDLACINFNDSSSFVYEISNPGTLASLTITNARMSGPDSAYFRVTPTTWQIPPGGKGRFTITFDPEVPRNFSAAFRFNSDADEEREGSLPITACAVTGVLATDSTMSLGSLCKGGTIDTTIILRNVGTDTLHVTQVTSSRPGYLGVVSHSQLPRVIPPNGSDTVRVLFTASRFDPAGSDITFRTDAYVAVHSLRVYATNGQPLPALPSEVSFAAVDLQSSVRCSESDVTITNSSASESLILRRLRLVDPRFSIVRAPLADTVLDPGGSVIVRLRFCPVDDGSFAARLPVSFFGGSCPVDTAIALNGVTILTPLVSLDEPASGIIEFAPVLPGTTTPKRDIVIRNRGTGSSTLNVEELETYGITTLSELSVTISSGDYVLEPGDSLKFSVTMTPAGKGARGAVLRLSATDLSWSDSVQIFGEGAAKAGVAVTSDTLDFGSVRVGGKSERELVVSNIGPLVSIDRLRIDSASFRYVGDPLPDTLDSGNPEGRYRLVFEPNRVGEFVAELTVYNSSGETPKKYLRGTGILEAITVDPLRLDFGCQPVGGDSILTVKVTNSGTAPLDISGVSIATGADAFTVERVSGVETLAPNASRTYEVTYRPTVAQHAGILRVVNSTGTNLDIPLTGTLCGTETTISLLIPDREEMIGTAFMLPILVDLGGIYDRDVTYKLTLTYEPGLLRPLIEGRPDQLPPLTTGTVSSSAGMEELAVGKLEVSGTIKAGRRSDTLVGIPMRVLLSHTNSTVIAIQDVVFSVVDGTPTPKLGTARSGILTALDCDTTRRIITGVGYKLSQNVPNPTSPSTVIRYQVAFTERTVINLYDATGTFVRTLVDQMHVPGGYELRLDASDLGSGVYTYEMISGPFRKTLRMVVVE